MPDVKDVIVKKPTQKEIKESKGWPIWQSDVSSFDWAYTQTETCYILEGQVTVSDKDSSVEFGPDDMVIFPTGLECTWNIRKAVKKHYKFD